MAERESGMEAAIKRFAIDNPVFGICGGYQMLGMQIDDPEQTEEGGSIRGMELLPIRTVLKLQKQTRQVTGTFDKVAGIFSCLSGQSIRGYEIHMERLLIAGMQMYRSQICRNGKIGSCMWKTVRRAVSRK